MARVRDDRERRVLRREHEIQLEDRSSISPRTQAGRAYLALFLWNTFGLMAVLIVACLVGYLVAQAIGLWLPRSVWSSHVLPAMLIAASGLGSVYGIWLPVVQRLTRPVHLAQERCIACGYRLQGLTREDDGCVVCPECGAAWRLDPNPDA
ncbi:MAG: hypothetical protein DHS20C14_11960 [Phycisphaeraceae bacterium]|nr:MAG: hypothetical protein DHS20C14_11960 [Phycisphaeraceae bacterium]